MYPKSTLKGLIHLHDGLYALAGILTKHLDATSIFGIWRSVVASYADVSCQQTYARNQHAIGSSNTSVLPLRLTARPCGARAALPSVPTPASLAVAVAPQPPLSSRPATPVPAPPAPVSGSDVAARLSAQSTRDERRGGELLLRSVSRPVSRPVSCPVSRIELLLHMSVCRGRDVARQPTSPSPAAMLESVSRSLLQPNESCGER
mmetsp:Transcript_21923/g.53870  ORF Transcript_21923/g.53870 Transcript_21923/m.53870 type:complete len:205 (+) Transcript_21923:45-659(+)